MDMADDDDEGDIFTKSDVGSFLYNNTLKPYALSEISPTSMIIPNSVDSLTYTSFESVKIIEEDPYSATFVYNADNARAKMEVKQNTTTILARWYPESSYIKETASGTTREYTFIGGDSYTAPVVAITQSGTTTYYILLRDHLGSITHVVNASTNTLEYQYSYDAWDRMRSTSGWVNYDPGSEPALFIAGRGFTGHEHLPWFNLINMNGRMYDPIAGQFLSPDNNIQDPYNSQNLNRYSYCVNNPLKYTDPTGFNVSVTVQYVHDIVYGPQSHVDQMLKELFGAMYEDVFHGGYDYAFLISGFGGNRGGGGNNAPGFGGDNSLNQKSGTTNQKTTQEKIFRYLVITGYPIEALKTLISYYDLDFGVEKLYSLNIKPELRTRSTTEGYFGEKQTIFFGPKFLTNLSWGTTVKSVYHEMIHVSQHYYELPMKDFQNQDVREFIAYSQTLMNSWLPAEDQQNRTTWYGYAIRHYSSLSPDLSTKYYYLYIRLQSYFGR